MKSAFLSRFTPSLMPAEALEAIFVQREREARRTVELVRESVLTANKSHTLFVGPRGIGKTHLVSLIYHRLRAMEDLRDRLLIAWLREEEWGVSSFLDVLQRILRALAEDDPAWEPRVAAIPKAATEAAAERAAKALLHEIVGDRTLLLLAENLDDLFDGIGDEGQKRFRAFLQDTRFSSILATSQSLFGGVSRQGSPFYNFFRIQHLPGLSLDEAVSLLTKIAQLEEDVPLTSFLHTPAGRARVRAVHHLAGGNPRVYVIFSEFLTREALDELVSPFLKMLDELTPYYQSKMRYLSPQQRKIVEILTDARGTVPVKEIAARSFLTHQTVSSQLKELREKGYVRSYPVGREAYYELQEPLMRLCMEVKKQRGEPIKLFVDFLRLWCTREDLERRLTSLPLGAVLTERHLREALRLSENEEDPRVTACLRDHQILVDQQNHEKALQISEELIAIRGHASDWATKGWHLDDLDREDEAMAAFNQALIIDSSRSDIWFVKAAFLKSLARYDEALPAFEQATALNPTNAVAWHGLGITLTFIDHNSEAIAAYNQALTLNPNVADVWRNKGVSLVNLGHYEEALTSFDQAIRRDKNPHTTRSHLYRAATLLCLNRRLEAFSALADLLPQFQDEPKELSNFTELALSHLLADDQAEWSARAEMLASLYRQHGGGLVLGQALTATIPDVNSPLISTAARQIWLETWQEAAGEIAEMRLPLRLLDAAIRYYDSGTPPDPRILLELPVEERSILESLLGVNQE